MKDPEPLDIKPLGEISREEVLANLRDLAACNETRDGLIREATPTWRAWFNNGNNPGMVTVPEVMADFALRVASRRIHLAAAELEGLANEQSDIVSRMALRHARQVVLDYLID